MQEVLAALIQPELRKKAYATGRATASRAARPDPRASASLRSALLDNAAQDRRREVVTPVTKNFVTSFWKHQEGQANLNGASSDLRTLLLGAALLRRVWIILKRRTRVIKSSANAQETQIKGAESLPALSSRSSPEHTVKGRAVDQCSKSGISARAWCSVEPRPSSVPQLGRSEDSRRSLT